MSDQLLICTYCFKAVTTIVSGSYGTISYRTQSCHIARYKVMPDFDLAAPYEIETKALKQAVRRNLERFPSDLMFELTREEYHSLRSQIVTLKNERGYHSEFAPFAFMEQGVAMLSSVLNSYKALQVNITIMRAFISVRPHDLDSKT